MIIIDEKGDLVIRVTELTRDDGGERSVVGVEEFRVRRQTLIEASIVWRKMLGSLTWAEGSQDTVNFEDDPLKSTEILFRVLHNAVSEDTYEVPIKDIWRLMAMVKKWRMKIHFLKPWFADWYKKQIFDEDDLDEDEQRQLLFPCWSFDHPNGFAMATHFLAYNNFRHIKERNPTEFRDLHLPHRIISQLNAAKGNLRTVIHRRLYGPIKHLLGTRCKCKAETLWGYEKALYDTGAWPLEEVGKGHSMHDIMNRLGKFKYKVAETACMFPCHQNFERIVEDGVTYTAQNFNGLCLDCMDRMKPKTGDRHDDYWRHNNFRDRDVWFEGCRIKHKQPTWYFSFMGSQEDKDYLQSKDKRPYESDSDSDRYP